MSELDVVSLNWINYSNHTLNLIDRIQRISQKAIFCLICIAFLFIILSQNALANSAVITVSATIRSAPCTVNNNNTINVNFGDAVNINDIDGKKYMQDIVYSVECSGGFSGGMTLSIQGNPADFDDGAALDAGHGGLGIEIQNEGEKLTLGKAINFEYPAFPLLQAVPVMKAGATLDTGDFSAGATMVLGLQ